MIHTQLERFNEIDLAALIVAEEAVGRFIGEKAAPWLVTLVYRSREVSPLISANPVELWVSVVVLSQEVASHSYYELV